MAKRIEESKNLVKVYWTDVRRYVIKVNPVFAELVDKLNLPPNEFPLYIARYPYGASLDDEKGAILPTEKGRLCRLSDVYFSDDVMKDLEYGKNSLPLGMVLDKQMEYFFDLKTQKLTIPIKMYTPGMFFALNGILNKSGRHTTVANVLTSASAGARSALMLPNISSSIQHLRLKHILKIDSPVPKCLYEHGLIFKEISESKNANCTWKLELLYFSHTWVEKINADPAWMPLRLYWESLYHNAFSYGKDHFFNMILFSLLQKEAHLKVSPNLTDTIRWLFTIASNKAPGYAPAIDNESLPLDTLQYSYARIYKLEKRLPIIMIPQKFDIKNLLPVYYPLKYPSFPQFSMKMRESSTILSEMRDLYDIQRFFLRELSKKECIFNKTFLAEIAKNVLFDFFHCDRDTKRIVKSSLSMLAEDERFNTTHHSARVRNAVFPRDSAFLRGCIRIKPKN